MYWLSREKFTYNFISTSGKIRSSIYFKKKKVEIKTSNEKNTNQFKANLSLTEWPKQKKKFMSLELKT
jgi:hypothetical protein